MSLFSPVHIHLAEARRFMAASNDRWDHINLTLLQTSPAIGRGRSHVDGQVLTVEAVQTYLNHLRACTECREPRGLRRRSVSRADAAVTSGQALGISDAVRPDYEKITSHDERSSTSEVLVPGSTDFIFTFPDEA